MKCYPYCFYKKSQMYDKLTDTYLMKIFYYYIIINDFKYLETVQNIEIWTYLKPVQIEYS